MMTSSISHIRDEEMPPFAPLLELIPSFKLIREKSMLSEYRVGKGRILFCGLNLTSQSDPASLYMKDQLLAYLGEPASWVEDAPQWEVEALKKRLRQKMAPRRKEKKIDFGGRIAADQDE